eukprot:COSAG05_NODE_1682_length_4285_cov_33.861682_8_plen_53_part_00
MRAVCRAAMSSTLRRCASASSRFRSAIDASWLCRKATNIHHALKLRIAPTLM